MRSIRIAAVLTLAVAPALFAQSASPAAEAAATIVPADVKAHIAFLASDSLMGRDTPSPGLELAAKYIAERFKAYGLKPGGDAGTFIQRWPYETRKLDFAKVSGVLRGKGQDRSIEIGKDFFVIPGAQDSLAGGFIYAGVAAVGVQGNPAYGGNIVAFYVPGADMMDPAWQQNLQSAAIAGISSGARGVVLLLDPAFDADKIGNLVSNLGGQVAPVPVIGIRNDVARAWLTGTAIDLAQPAVTAPLNAEGLTLQVRTSMSGGAANPPNVVGIIEGSDPALKDTYIVFSAHMDHVGVGRPNAAGDSIYNGADDDASGTSAILELAEAFSSLKERPKRSLIFLTVSGEEKGLLGSKHFVDHPPVPIWKMVANINLDMIGRNAADSTVAIGQEYSSLGTITQEVVKAHPELKLVVAPDLWPNEKLFFRSDHFNFAMKKVPAIFFTSGLHKDYHQPSDEPETIDNDKLARTARLVFWLGHEIANSAAAPTWTPEGLKATNQPGGN